MLPSFSTKCECKIRDRASSMESVRLLAGLKNNRFDPLLALSKRENAKARSVTCHKGQPGDAPPIVATGKFRVSAESEEGERRYWLFGKDGEASLLGECARSVGVMAIRDSVALDIQQREFIACLAPNSQALRLSPRHALPAPYGRPIGGTRFYISKEQMLLQDRVKQTK